jgi:RNA:NAD 2'-phosphotransferase (TPT1/KptA family)
MTTITLTLPERTMEQAQQAATVLKRPVEEVLSDILAAVLPTVHDAPAEMQAELTRMTWLDSQELWRMAREQMPAETQEQLRQLTQVQGQRALTSKEQAQLDALRQEYGRITLLKARAYALLSLRGGEPLLGRS